MNALMAEHKGFEHNLQSSASWITSNKDIPSFGA
jgi:hypothetical protein